MVCQTLLFEENNKNQTRIQSTQMPPPFALYPYGNNYFPNAQSDLFYILTPGLTTEHDPGATLKWNEGLDLGK